MNIVHIDELAVQSRQPRGRIGKSVKTSAIMHGDPSRVDNFNFRILYDEAGDIYSPRHHHNFCQLVQEANPWQLPRHVDGKR